MFPGSCCVHTQTHTVTSIKASRDWVLHSVCTTLASKVCTVLSKTLSSPMASASFLMKVVSYLQLSKVTCLPLQGWARGTLVSITRMTEGAIAPSFTESTETLGSLLGGFLQLAALYSFLRLTAQIGPLSSSIAFALVKRVQREPLSFASFLLLTICLVTRWQLQSLVPLRGPNLCKLKRSGLAKRAPAACTNLPEQTVQEAVPPASWAGRQI